MNDNGSALFELMKLQGRIRMYLVQCGVDEEATLTMSGQILDKVIKSPMAKDEYKQAYEELGKGRTNEP